MVERFTTDMDQYIFNDLFPMKKHSYHKTKAHLLMLFNCNSILHIYKCVCGFCFFSKMIIKRKKIA